jgi:hypothetical protein
MKTFGLMAALPVHLFLDRERHVRWAVEAFADDRGPDHVVVAGPPTRAEIEAHKLIRRGSIMLPVVRLNFRMVTRHLTHERGIEVTCSDADLEKLIDWQRQYDAKHKYKRIVA